MMLPATTRIAGQKTVADWTNLKGRLAGCNDAALWNEAFNDYFKARLENRYFRPIRVLEDMKEYHGVGFAVVALHCSLIEFLASTRKGINYRYVRRGDDPLDKELEYSNSSELFQRFLTCQSPFCRMFKDKNSAQDFYANVRCGLLHEARTKGAWRIRVDPGAREAIDTGKRVIYRNKMQAAFDEVIKDYGEQLIANAKLQEAFIRKFDALCKE
jgi:hypothetical protein